MSRDHAADPIVAMRNHVQASQARGIDIDRQTLLRDAVCIRTLLDAADARAARDDAEYLLSESIAMLASNIWHISWDGVAGKWPANVVDAAGRLAAVVRARNGVLQETLTAADDQHSFLVDQVGWLDGIADETVARLIESLQRMPSAAGAWASDQ